jgi:hypothetical protein
MPESVDEITIGIVSWYSADLIDNLIANLTQKTSSSTKLSYLVCDNTNGEDTVLYEKLDDKCTIFPNDQGDFPVKGHANGLNALLARVETDLCVFADPDVMVLMKDWDKICKAALSDKVVAIGTPYPPMLIAHHTDFPVVYFVLFKAQMFKDLGVSYNLPDRVSARDYIMCRISRQFAYLMRHTWGPSFFLGKGGEIARAIFGGSNKDTGWRVGPIMREHGYEAKKFTIVSLPSQLGADWRNIEEARVLSDEFQLFLWEGLPIVTHLLSVRHKQVSPTRLINRLFMPVVVKRRKHKTIQDIIDYWKATAWSVSEQMDRMPNPALEHSRP